MELKDIKLKKGMTKEEVNELTKDYVLLDDDIYLGNKEKHNWKCLCGNIIEGRTWDKVRGRNSVKCKKCKIINQEQYYKHKVEKDGDYEYIRSYHKGDVLPNGNICGNHPYLQVKHKYCGSVYEIISTQFINANTRCSKCCGSYENSFAHHIEVELGLNINDVWDFEKNTVNPYHIYKNRNDRLGKVWMKCTNKDINKLNGIKKKDYHSSYQVSCNNFYKGERCSYCRNRPNSVHLYDSFGYNNFDKACMNWHQDNEISPFSISLNNGNRYKFICDKCRCEWSSTISSVNNGTWCPSCASSKGEKRIEKWLIENGIEYEIQKEFDGLLGLSNGNLSYDFYLSNHNLLIEYQGGFHDNTVTGSYQKQFDFEKQQEHDKRKKQYSVDNNIELLEIWYWDFDNIEKILNKKYEW